MGKETGSGSEMNNPDHISESFETIFWDKILQFFDGDPEWKYSDPGSGINIPDPQHWLYTSFEKNFWRGVRNTFTGIEKIYLVWPSADIVYGLHVTPRLKNQPINQQNVSVLPLVRCKS
jgi:hypothetical protein